MYYDRMKNAPNTIGRQTLHLMFAKFITAGIALVSAMLFSRFQTVPEYGVYSQLIMVITLASSLIMFGLPNSIDYFLVLYPWVHITISGVSHVLVVYQKAKQLMGIHILTVRILSVSFRRIFHGRG